MGTACYVERKYDTSDADLDYGLCLTGMPIYDKLYLECQYHTERFDWLKSSFENSKAELAAVINAEVITTGVYVSAIERLITQHAESNPTDKIPIQFLEKHPYILLDSHTDSELVNTLRPAIKFIMLLRETLQELAKIDIFIHTDKSLSKTLFENYEMNAMKAGLNDFDKALGRQRTKANFQIMSNVAFEVRMYQQELETISKLLPKQLSQLKEKLSNNKSAEKK